MKRRTAILLSSGLAVLLFAGSRQVSDYVGSLKAGGWELCEHDGALYAVESRWAGKLPAKDRTLAKWALNAPLVKALVGKEAVPLLLTVVEADPPTLRLAAEKDAPQEWTFEIVQRIEPGIKKVNMQGPFKVGNSGYVFKLRAAAGKHKGWYLAAEELTDEQEKNQDTQPVYRRLRLTEDAKEAVEFTYIDTRFGVG